MHRKTKFLKSAHCFVGHFFGSWKDGAPKYFSCDWLDKRRYESAT